MTETRRRHLLKVLGTGGTAAVAGCIGDGDDDGPLGSDDDGDDDGSPGSDDDGGEGGDDDLELDEDVQAADVLDESDLSGFVAEVDFGQVGATQTVYEGDAYMEFDADGMMMEYFYIDNNEYEVTPDGCRVMTDVESDLDLVFVVWLDPFRGYDPDDFSVIDRTTIDGEEVYVIEDPNETWKMYVSAETGYRVKEDMGELDLEADSPGGGMGGGDGSIEFHSWNETSPIEPPDMDCEEI